MYPRDGQATIDESRYTSRWADDAPHTRQALSLVWRRFAPPRFKLSAVSESGGDTGCGFKPQDIRQVRAGSILIPQQAITTVVDVKSTS